MNFMQENKMVTQRVIPMLLTLCLFCSNVPPVYAYNNANVESAETDDNIKGQTAGQTLAKTLKESINTSPFLKHEEDTQTQTCSVIWEPIPEDEYIMTTRIAQPSDSSQDSNVTIEIPESNISTETDAHETVSCEEETPAIEPKSSGIEQEVATTNAGDENMPVEEPSSDSMSNNNNDTQYNKEDYEVYTIGTTEGPSGHETYYNLSMSGVIDLMRKRGYTEEDGWKYWIRDDGVKMFGDYAMVAANLDIRPKGTIIPTSVGMAIVCDTGDFANDNIYAVDIATTW